MGTVEDQAAQWGVTVGRVNQVNQLADQWEQLVGYQQTLDNSMLQRAATSDAIDLHSFGVWMVTNGGMATNLRTSMPWAEFGIDHNEYQARISSINAAYQRLTGRALNTTPQNGTWDGDYGVIADALLNNKSVADLEQSWMQDANMQKTYGWLKFGLNYDQFQRQKADYRTSFGGDLTDDQAINQLKYDHALGHVLGAYQTAQLQPESPAQQQQPAQPSAGLTGSQVR